LPHVGHLVFFPAFAGLVMNALPQAHCTLIMGRPWVAV